MGEGRASPYITTTKKEEARLLGVGLRQVREALQMTQEEVSEALGLDPVTYSRYETGARMCPLQVVRGMATLSGISMGDFFAGPDEVTQGIVPVLAGHIHALSISAQVALAEFLDATLSQDREERLQSARSRHGLPLYGQLVLIRDHLNDLGFDYGLVKDPEQGWVLWPSELIEEPEDGDTAADESDLPVLPPEKND